MPLGLRRMDFESRGADRRPPTAETPRPAATSLNVSPVLRKDRFCFGQAFDPPQDHVAVRRRDLTAVARPVQHVGRGHRRSAPEERIEDHIAGIGERLHEELDQCAWERRRVRSLAALGLHLDYVAGARDASVDVVRPLSPAPAPGSCRHRPRAPVPRSPLPEFDFGLSGE